MSRILMIAALCASAWIAAPFGFGVTPVQAHGGEDHGPAAAATAPAPIPRRDAGFGATTEMFEIVLTPDAVAGHSLLFLAEADTNAPVVGAAIDAEASGWTGRAIATAQAGVYRLDWAIPKDATVDLALTVAIGERMDLLLLAGVGQTTAPPKIPADAWFSQPRARWIAGALAAAVAVVAVVLARRRRPMVGAVLALALLPGPALAHDGEDHGTPAAPVAAAGVTVALSKASQFMLGLRTQRIKPEPMFEFVRLVGKVIPDPDAYARIQPSQISRVVADPDIPIPVSGQAVKRGQAVAVLDPSLTSVERTGQRAALYKTESEIAQIQRKLDRYARAETSLPRKDAEDARSDLARLFKEREQLLKTALGREVLHAPVDGKITEVHIVPGEVVNPDTVLAEIVDPDRLWIEAVLFDLTLADRIVAGLATTKLLPDETFELHLKGVSQRVNPVDQGLHLLFAVDRARGLRLGLSVDVLAQTGATRHAILLPRQAILDTGGLSTVFVHVAPESFEARTVTLGRVLGGTAEVVEGLKPGERVVTEGARHLLGAR